VIKGEGHAAGYPLWQYKVDTARRPGMQENHPASAGQAMNQKAGNLIQAKQHRYLIKINQPVYSII
jgi:hypothetical protein